MLLIFNVLSKEMFLHDALEDHFYYDKISCFNKD